jgi:uncharacterized protein
MDMSDITVDNVATCNNAAGSSNGARNESDEVPFSKLPPVAVSSRLTKRHPQLAAAVLFSLGAFMCSGRSEADSTPAEAKAADANAALIMSAYDAFGRGDMQTVFRVFDKEILWHVPGRGPLSRDYRGPAEVSGFFDHFMGLSGGTFRLQINEVLAKGDRVVVLCTETAQRGGRTWSSPQVHVWTVKDGHAVGFWEYEGDQQSEDEFWSIRD